MSAPLFFQGRIDGRGRMEWDDQEGIAKRIYHLRNKRVIITIEEPPSHDQHKFYRGVLLPAFAEGMGFGFSGMSQAHQSIVLAHLHDRIKRELLPEDPTSRAPKRKIRSTARMSKRQFSSFIEGVYELAADLGIELPTVDDPKMPLENWVTPEQESEYRRIA